MRKYVKVLTESEHNKAVGNHSVKHYIAPAYFKVKEEKNGNFFIVGATRVFCYHENAICYVNDNNRWFFLTHAGWYTSSTSCALNGYKEYFESIGYKNMTE